MNPAQISRDGNVCVTQRRQTSWTRVIVPAPFVVCDWPRAGDLPSTSRSRVDFSGCSRFLASNRSSRPQADR